MDSENLGWIMLLVVCFSVMGVMIGSSVITAKTFTIQGKLIGVNHIDDPNWNKGLTQLVFNTTSGYAAVNYNNDYAITWEVNSSYTVFFNQRFNSYVNLESAVKMP